MTRRVGTTRQAAEHFGFVRDDGHVNCRAFTMWARTHGITPEHGTCNNFWWNFKAIENALDGSAGVQPKSSDWKKKFMEAFKNGESVGAIPH